MIDIRTIINSLILSEKMILWNKKMGEIELKLKRLIEISRICEHASDDLDS